METGSWRERGPLRLSSASRSLGTWWQTRPRVKTENTPFPWDDPRGSNWSSFFGHLGSITDLGAAGGSRLVTGHVKSEMLVRRSREGRQGGQTAHSRALKRGPGSHPRRL